MVVRQRPETDEDTAGKLGHLIRCTVDRRTGRSGRIGITGRADPARGFSQLPRARGGIAGGGSGSPLPRRMAAAIHPGDNFHTGRFGGGKGPEQASTSTQGRRSRRDLPAYPAPDQSAPGLPSPAIAASIAVPMRSAAASTSRSLTWA